MLFLFEKWSFIFIFFEKFFILLVHFVPYFQLLRFYLFFSLNPSLQVIPPLIFNLLFELSLLLHTPDLQTFLPFLFLPSSLPLGVLLLLDLLNKFLCLLGVLALEGEVLLGRGLRRMVLACVAVALGGISGGHVLGGVEG